MRVVEASQATARVLASTAFGDARMASGAMLCFFVFL
eukprot:CAMPEP_0177452028 /NCGR_PEP_ID=MMETSP0369-20130122/10093_1 /TAXON_ID=447022 ORGANISM="Scrippsiella hangoei-like, Strain SHHI-4" /NCGR_SAMPLE_ID=MMETSP0369 /ASSEMBLY_ACC=CAM_ASM_000364 /LENGTH=36 /DNA_ID= /DNA_START= /DNA_END= /DNA_ORIENTATION=